MHQQSQPHYQPAHPSISGYQHSNTGLPLKTGAAAGGGGGASARQEVESSQSAPPPPPPLSNPTAFQVHQRAAQNPLGPGELPPPLTLLYTNFQNSVHGRDSYGNTPLHLAALAQSCPHVTAFVSMGADPLATNLVGDTPAQALSRSLHNQTIGPNTALVAQMLMCAEAQATSRRGHDMPHSASQFQNSMGYGMMAQLQPGAAGAGGGNVLPAFAAHPSQWQFRTFSDPANERVGLTRKRKQEKEPPREFLADKLARQGVIIVPPWLNPEFKAQEKKREKEQQAQKLGEKKQKDFKRAVEKQEQQQQQQQQEQEQQQQQRQKIQKQIKQDNDVHKSAANVAILPQPRNGKLAATPSDNGNSKQLVVK